MWIEKRKNHYRLYDRYTDPSGISHKVSVKFDKDTTQQRNKAKQRLDQLIAERNKVIEYDLTFEQLTKIYLMKKEPLLKASTHRRNTRECDTFNKLFGKVKIADLSAPYVRTKLLDKSKNKPSTYNEHLQRFKEIIKWGYVNDFVEDQSFINKLTPLKDKSKKEKIADKFLEKDECQVLLDAMTHEGRQLTEFMLLSGLRIGEALALTEDDLDFDLREINVSKTLDPITKEITEPKTFASIRKVYMQNALLTLCEAIRDDLDSRPRIYPNEPKPLFWNAQGTPYEYTAYNKYLGEVSEKVLGRKITTHVLRHTHASLMAENGVDYEVIARRLGHENSSITKQIYIHVTERREKKDNEEIKDVDLI